MSTKKQREKRRAWARSLYEPSLKSAMWAAHRQIAAYYRQEMSRPGITDLFNAASANVVTSKGFRIPTYLRPEAED